MLEERVENTKLNKEEDKYEVIEYSKFIDHTILKPESTESDILKLCEEAIEYKFASVCVNPYWAKFAKNILKDFHIKLCIVVGFPLGMNNSEVKAYETKIAIENGANEIDMVINIGALKSKKYDVVKNDIEAVVKAASISSNNKVIVKVIIETCLLTNEEKVIACKLAKEAGAQFVKTSTGFSKSGATFEDVKLMKETVGDSMLIKASGGIRTKTDMDNMIKAGASRIGASASVDIMKSYVSEQKFGNC